MKTIRRTPLLASIALLAALCAQAQNNPTEDHLQRTFSLQPGSNINIKNYKGLIRIEAADSGQATLDVKKVWEGHGDKQRDEWLRELQVNINNDDKHLDVKVEYPNHSCMWDCDEWGGHVELVLRVPREVNVDVDGYKPDLEITGIKGNIRVRSYKSPMKITNTSGAIDIDTYKDRVLLEDVSLRGLLRVHSYKAETEIRSRELADGADLEASRGEIRLYVPADTRMNLDITGDRRSDIHTDFPISMGAGYSRRISGAVNGGGPEVRIRGGRGSVAVLKNNQNGL